MALVLLLSIPITFLLTALFSRRRRTRLVADGSTHPGLLRLDRTSLAARWAGLGLGLVAAWTLATTVYRWGLGLLLSPAALASCLLLALVLGELLAWRAARTPGVASLETRSASRYLPSRMFGALAGSLAALAALLLWCRAHQNTEPDDMGTIGRQYAWKDPYGLSSGGGGPFPGTFYSVPLAWALLALLLVLAVGLMLVLRRPRNGADPVVVAVDDQVRARNAEAMVATAVLGVAGSLAPCALLASGPPMGIQPGIAVALIALTFAALAVGAWAAAVLLVPGRGEKVA